MAIIPIPLPYVFSNGTVADATQVNADINTIVANVNTNVVPNTTSSPTGGAAVTGAVASTYNSGATVQQQLTNVGSATGATNVGFTPPGTGAVPTTVAAKLAQSVSVMDFGADPTGATDSTAALQNAINYAQSNSYSLYLPSGTYKTTAPLSITAGVRLYGDGWVPYVGNAVPAVRGNGTWLHFAHLGKGFDVSNGTTAFSGVFFERIATMRDQPAPGPGWSPIAADYDFYVGNSDVHINDVLLWNPTKGIQINGPGGGRLTIDGLRGQPLGVGINLLCVEDFCFLNNVEFWVYWANDQTYVVPYTKFNATALLCQRSDAPFVMNFSAYGYMDTVAFGYNNTVTPQITSSAKLVNIDSDTFGNNAIHVLAGAAGTSFDVSNLGGFSGSSVSNGIRVESTATGCTIQADNVRFRLLGFCGSTVNGVGTIAQYSNWLVGTPTEQGYNTANNNSSCFYSVGGSKTIVDGPVTANGWIASGFVPTYVTPTTFTTLTDSSSVLKTGLRLQFIDGSGNATVGVCVSNSGGSPSTVTIQMDNNSTFPATLASVNTLPGALTNGQPVDYTGILESGNFSISASTNVVMVHGLGYAPSRDQIDVKFGIAGGGGWWVDTTTTTNFTIHIATSTTTSGTYSICGRSPALGD